MIYSNDAVLRAKVDALEWLMDHADGYPRTHKQEQENDKRRESPMYDADDAPPIIGYEALEREGKVVRMETVVRHGQERVRFRLSDHEG